MTDNNGYTHKGYVKFNDSRFIILLNDKHIFCLIETHCSLDKCLTLPNYYSVHLARPKNPRAVKKSGGQSIYVKQELRPGIKFLIHQTNDYIWL